MKNMMIAVFAVLAAASVARAGECASFFDGGIRPASLADLLAETPGTAVPVAVSAYHSEAGTAQGQAFMQLRKDKQQVLSAVAAKGDLFARDFRMLMGDAKTDILYNDAAAYFVTKEGNRYVTTLKSTDKRFIALLHKADTPALQNKNAVICILVEKVLWELVKGVWTQVIREVKECYTAPDPTPNDPAHSGDSGPITWPVRSVRIL